MELLFVISLLKTQHLSASLSPIALV